MVMHGLIGPNTLRNESGSIQSKSSNQDVSLEVFSSGWDHVLLDAVARRGSGHTPSKSHPEYWNGDIKWISLQDSKRLDQLYISDTSAKITPKGIDNSSACLHPSGTVVLSRDAGVGKSAIMSEEMAVSQHFMAWQCGPKLNNHYLYFWLQSKKPEFERMAVGNTIGTIGLSFFRGLRIPLPPRNEQDAISEALIDAESHIQALDRAIRKKRLVRQGAMQELLSGRCRLPGFEESWIQTALGKIGATYGGLTGKAKQDFGCGTSLYVPFMNVMANVIVNPEALENVSVQPGENQNRVAQYDLLFNGSSETPEELGFASVVWNNLKNVYLNSFCFGFRPFDQKKISSLYLAYYFRSEQGRERLRSLAQGATRYNLSKRALMGVEVLLPEHNEQEAIAETLLSIDNEIQALELRLKKARWIKQGMMQELLTGRVRLV